jgi:hypothetical protein
MKQSGHLSQNNVLGRKGFIALKSQQIEEIDFEKAKQNVLPFLKDPDSVRIWSRNFFQEIIKNIKFDS